MGQGYRAVQWNRQKKRYDAVLVAGSGEASVAGQHRLDFEYVLPPVLFWSPRRSKRRVRVQAALDCGGRPLRSLAREVRLES